MFGFVVIIAILIESSFATTGVDISQICGEFSCLKSSHGVDFSISRGWYSSGSFDSGVINNLNNAKAAGIPYNDVYLFPCRGKSATTQVDDLIADLAAGLNGLSLNNTKQSNDAVARGLRAGYTPQEKANKVWLNRTNIFNHHNHKQRSQDVPEWRKGQEGATYGMIWMDIEANPSGGCGWGTNYASNCDYLNQLISATTAKGQHPGVYSSLGEWEQVMGSRDACTSPKGTPLWYAHYDNNPSFSDWSSMKFGGWSSPAMKQYAGDVTWCSFDVDADWY